MAVQSSLEMQVLASLLQYLHYVHLLPNTFFGGGDKDEDNATYCDIYLSYFEDNDVAMFIFLMSFFIMHFYK